MNTVMNFRILKNSGNSSLANDLISFQEGPFFIDLVKFNNKINYPSAVQMNSLGALLDMSRKPPKIVAGFV